MNRDFWLYKIFYLSIFSFVFGILISNFLDFSLRGNFFYLLIFFGFLGFFIFLGRKKAKFFSALISFLFLSLFFIFGFFRSEIFLEKQGKLENYLFQESEFSYIVADEPERKNGKTKLILEERQTKSKVIVYFFENNFSYGDLLKVKGFLTYPENFDNGEGRVFDYKNYLKKDGIFYILKPVSFEKISENEGKFLKEKLFTFKSFILQKINFLIPYPESALLGGLLLGSKESMGNELLENFRKTGVIHIVVLSGFNLTIVADFIMKILAFFGLTISAIFGSISIIFFTIMTGASATIVRASIMALLVILARVLGRESEIIRALYLAGFFMLLLNPMLLLYDPSFQLSFLATIGLIILSPKIEEKISYLPKKFLDLRGILAATLGTGIMVMPLLLYMMGEISIISPLVNLLVLIVVPAVMFLGFLAFVFGVFSNFLGLILAFFSYFILLYILEIVDFFADFSFSVLQVKSFDIYHLIFVYFLYFCIWIFYQKKKL